MNYIDGIVIIALIVCAIVAYMILSDDEASVPTSVVDLQAVVELDFIEAEFEETIIVGDPLIALNTKQSGVITDLVVESYVEVAAVNGELVEVADPGYRRMIVSVDLKATKYGPYMDFSGNEMKAGLAFELETETYAFKGKIIDVKVVD